MRRRRAAFPWLWLAITVLGLVVIAVSDQPAWPLAVWIASTLGTVVVLDGSSRGRQSEPQSRKGTHS